MTYPQRCLKMVEVSDVACETMYRLRGYYCEGCPIPSAPRALDQDRALDQRIAEIMGFQLVRTGYEMPGYLQGRMPGEPLLRALPHYATNIAAAWEVADKLGLGLCRVDVYSGQGSVGDSQRFAWAAFQHDILCSEEEFLCGTRQEEIFEDMTLADTAPLAICLAALKAHKATARQEDQ